MYEAAIVIAMVIGYLLGNSIDKKLDKEARDDMIKRAKMKRKFGHGAISEHELFSEIGYRSRK